MKPALKDFQDWYKKHEKRIFDDYFTLLKFQSVSTDLAYKKEVDACAEWLQRFIQKIGLNVEVWPTSCNPVLFASHKKAGPSKPTLLIYNHYDVQPVDPLELWKSPPFEPTIREGKVYARGASDDKGQLFYVLTAIEAFFELSKHMDFNLKLFIEGEEECGSKGTKEAIKAKKEELKADYCLIVDTGIPNIETPAVTLSARGITTLQVEVRNSAIDLHSGIFGGIVLNPLQALVTALSRMWANGKVAIPHFYDEVVETSEQEKAEIDLAIDKEEMRKTFGIRVFGGEAGYTLGESNFTRPTLEINGLCGGYTGQGFKTVLPSMAQAKISCRLVPNQNPEKIGKMIAQFIEEQLPSGFTCKIEILSGDPSVRFSSKTPIAQIVKKAYEEVFSKSCLLSYGAGSIPIVADFQKLIPESIVLMGTAMDDDDIHAPNEHFSLAQFEKGFLTMSRLFCLMNG
jgi:acetylornithine deacetylase/succinyl-diaminopimelate desuccinylase-like protein